MPNQPATIFDEAEQLEPLVVPNEEVPLKKVQAQLVGPDEFTDTFFMAKKERLQLYRQPLYMRQVVKGEVISVQKQRDPFQFIGGRFPAAGDRITHAIADELRKHPLFNDRFLEYMPKAIPERTESRFAVENEKLREQIIAMETRQNEMAARLEKAYGQQQTPPTAPGPTTGPARQAASPSLAKALADQAAAVTVAATPTAATPTAAQSATRRGDHGPPDYRYPNPAQDPPAGTPDGIVLDPVTGLPQESEVPQTPPTEILEVNNKLRAIESLTGEPLNLPIQDMGSNPTKEDIITFAHRHNVAFPGYE